MLTMTMVLGTIMPSFVNDQSYVARQSILTDCSVELTEEEILILKL